MSIDLEEDGVEVVSDNTTLAAITRADIDCQITTAKRYPRSIATFKKQAMEMATLDEETAASMFYVLPRAGKKIEGPSVRLAEVVGSCWGNLRYGSRVVDIGETTITAQGACHDLEKNIAMTWEVQRRITNKRGERFNADMIQTTCNAACAIALREAIFRVVPRSVFKAIYEAARMASIGKAKTMSEKRHAALDWFKKAGATEPQLLAFLGRKGIDEITDDDLITLRGLVTAIKDGETTLDDALRPAEGHEAGSKVKASSANDKLKPQEKQEGDGQPSNADLAREQINNQLEQADTPEAVDKIVTRFKEADHGNEKVYDEEGARRLRRMKRGDTQRTLAE